jgi:hypothetical protein
LERYRLCPFWQTVEYSGFDCHPISFRPWFLQVFDSRVVDKTTHAKPLLD